MWLMHQMLYSLWLLGVASLWRMVPVCCPLLRVDQGVFAWHQRGYLHRDLKPRNLRQTTKGDAVIIDADAAKRIEDCKKGKIHRTQAVSGTTGYIDPLVESGTYDWSPAAEVWTLGTTLKEVCETVHGVGCVPFNSVMQCIVVHDLPFCCVFGNVYVGWMYVRVNVWCVCNWCHWWFSFRQTANTFNCLRGDPLRKVASLLTCNLASHRPCLGALLGKKCRTSNTVVCDGSAPDKCLYGSSIDAPRLTDLFHATATNR